MQPRLLIATSAILAIGTAAFVFARSHAAPVVTPDDVPSCSSGCTESECFTPSDCGDVDIVCPAGPDCFAPDVCPDDDVICPADPAPAGS